MSTCNAADPGKARESGNPRDSCERSGGRLPPGTRVWGSLGGVAIGIVFRTIGVGSSYDDAVRSQLRSRLRGGGVEGVMRHVPPSSLDSLALCLTSAGR